MKKLRPGLFLFLLIFTVSCDRPSCKNTNPIFDSFAPEAKEYKEELIRQLQMEKKKEISYWFDKYETKNKKEYILVHAQGRELCAKGLILVNDWKELEGIKRTRGQGYRGAELKGLRIDVRKDSVNTDLVFKDVDEIFD